MNINTLEAAKLEALLSQVRADIAEYLNEDNRLSRNLCRLALRYQVDEAFFAALLIQAGLRPQRASEIKTVLLAHEVCQQFVLENLNWKEALDKAGDDRGSAEQRAAGVLVRRLLKHGSLSDIANAKYGWSLESVSNKEYTLRSPQGVLRVIFSCRNA